MIQDIWPFAVAGLPLPGSSQSRGRARFFGLGEARLAILSLLDEAPKHGYQLMKDLGDRLGELYQSSAGTVYPTLKQLSKEGMVESHLREGRHIYRLTKEGRRLVHAEATTIEELWKRASDFQGIGRQLGPHTAVIASPLHELMMAGLAAANWSAGNPDREDRVRSVLRDSASRLRDLTQDSDAAHKGPRKER